MLTRETLEGLYRTLRDQHVLSVYIDGAESDPADRQAWRIRLENALSEERRRLEGDDEGDVAAFDAARGLIEDALARHRQFMPGPGWVGYATSEQLHHGEGVPVPMPDLVRWERGLRAAPYVRALKQDRVVVAALADQRKARLFTYRAGEITEREDLIADLDFGDLADSTSSKRADTQAGYSGYRGETGTDAAKRLIDRSAAQLQSRLIDLVSDLAGRDGFVVFGGVPEVVSALARQAESFADRVVQRPSMHIGMSPAEVKATVEDAASDASRRLQEHLLDRVVDAARAGGKGSLGLRATTEALRDGRVDILLVTRSARERDPDLVDRLVGTAFDQGAMVGELSEVGAARLDEEGEGVGARLRYTA
jgi:hypothetical protein